MVRPGGTSAGPGPVSDAEGLASVRRGYDGAAQDWADGAELVYGPLADALLARAPDLAGGLVLDVGAGTGAVSRRLLAAGARAIAVDASWSMLAHAASSRPPAVVGDIHRLPLADDAVDGAAAAFVLNHLADPVAALVELRRVVRPGGGVVASVFASADRAPAKSAIDDTLARAGWAPPEWYGFLKSVDGRVGSAVAMRQAAVAAGLDRVDVVEERVRTGVSDPRDIVRYRLSQPQNAPYVAALGDAERRRLVEDCVAAVAATGEPFEPGVVLLAARA